MSPENKSAKLVQVTGVDAVMNDGSRVTWQSYRPAAAEPDTKPTVYFTTLASNAEVGGTSVYNLAEIGAQAKTHAVELILTSAAPVTLELADASTVILDPESPAFTLPPRDADKAVRLSFGGATSSFEARPHWPEPLSENVAPLAMRDDEGGSNPPPPFPGGGAGH